MAGTFVSAVSPGDELVGRIRRRHRAQRFDQAGRLRRGRGPYGGQAATSVPSRYWQVSKVRGFVAAENSEAALRMIICQVAKTWVNTCLMAQALSSV